MPGAPGMKMYSREDLMGMNNFGNEDAEDEDDEDEHFPSNMVIDKFQSSLMLFFNTSLFYLNCCN
jgi:hypothetical protein